MSARDKTVIAVIAVLAAIAAAWLLVISPKRSQAGQLAQQLQSAQSQLATANSQVAQNQAAKIRFASNYATLVRLGEAVPVDDNVPSLIYQLQSAAGGAKVDFRSLQLNPGSASAAPAPTPGATGTSATSASSQLPPGASVGPAGFPTEQFTFVFQGNFFHLADFLHRVDRFVVAGNRNVAVSGRLMTLNAINLGPSPAGFPQISATISATTYLVPASQGLLNGATPVGPAASSSVPVSTSTPSTSTAAPAVVSSPAR